MILTPEEREKLTAFEKKHPHIRLEWSEGGALRGVVVTLYNGINSYIGPRTFLSIIEEVEEEGL